MSIRDRLLSLQWAQLKHDQSYHQDILILPPVQRIKHMVLHNTKYAAYFFSAVETRDYDRLIRALVDSFVIGLATANALNQDLGRDLPEISASVLPEETVGQTADPQRDPQDPLWIVRQFVFHNGRFAKICESWDHLEAVPFREGMKACNLALFKTVLTEIEARNLDIESAYKSRIREVEARSIFDDYSRKCKREED